MTLLIHSLIKLNQYLIRVNYTLQYFGTLSLLYTYSENNSYNVFQ